MSALFTRIVKERPTPDGWNMVPGIFSGRTPSRWARPLARRPTAGAPASHFPWATPTRLPRDGAATALSAAIAAVQHGYGNTAPLQIEIDPSIAGDEGAFGFLVGPHPHALWPGGTQINMNVMDVERCWRPIATRSGIRTWWCV